MNWNFQEKRYLVTGSSSGIGLGLCQSLDKIGAKLVLSSRAVPPVEKTREDFKRLDHLFLTADMSNFESIDSAVSRLKSENIKLDGAIFCAGVHMLRPLKMMKSENWLNAFLVNSIGPAHFFRGLVSNKILNSPSSVIFVSSIAALKSEPGASAYSGSKGSLLSMARSFAGEVASQGIRVNCISPGVVETRMSQSMMEFLPKEKTIELQKKHLLGIGAVSDVVDPILFLLSDLSRWMTGQNIIVDGGFSIV